MSITLLIKHYNVGNTQFLFSYSLGDTQVPYFYLRHITAISTYTNIWACKKEALQYIHDKNLFFSHLNIQKSIKKFVSLCIQ